MSRVFNAPRDLVWRVWTEPEHVARWWGPRGFSTQIDRMDFRVGGSWQHTMVGPDGVRYPNKSIFKEIVPQERIVYSHGGGREEGPGATFLATWTFDVVDAKRTRLTGRLTFSSAEARDFVAKEFGAVEGGQQTLERLSEYLPSQQGQPFVISREFDVGRDLMWQVWTQPEHFGRWFGPKGFASMNLAKMDLRAGGLLHYSMPTPDGKTMWGRAVYREVTPPSRIVWINSFSDAEGGITPHPFTKDPWPLQLLTEVTFSEKAGRTTVTVNWLPYEATDAEWQTFDAGRESMEMGWGGTLDRLGDHVAKP
jgi:uncharacterized protein YndB with AHSA1/START domain